MKEDDSSNIIELASHPKNDFFRPGRFRSEGEMGRMDDSCEKCGGPMVLRPLRPYPVLIQVLFGLNFLLLLVFFEKVEQPWIMWPWTLFQVVLGILLARGRKQAKRRVLRCVRCSAELG